MRQSLVIRSPVRSILDNLEAEGLGRRDLQRRQAIRVIRSVPRGGCLKIASYIGNLCRFYGS